MAFSPLNSLSLLFMLLLSFDDVEVVYRDLSEIEEFDRREITRMGKYQSAARGYVRMSGTVIRLSGFAMDLDTSAQLRV